MVNSRPVAYLFVGQGWANILFTGVSNMDGLKKWAVNAIFPAYEFTASAKSISDENLTKVIIELRKTDLTNLTSSMIVHRLAVKKGLFNSVQSIVDSATKSTAKKTQ